MFPGDPANAFLRPSPDGITAYQLWQLHKKMRDLRKEYLDYWQSTVQSTWTGRPVDAIICPVAPYAAPPHGMHKFVLPYVICVITTDIYHCIVRSIIQLSGMDWTFL